MRKRAQTPRVTLEIHRPRAEVVSIDAGGHRERVLARRDELILAHMGLVESIARQVMRSLPPSFELDDLIQTGQLALIDLATRYRPDAYRGAPFSAFARERIRGAMLDSASWWRYRDATCAPLEDLAEIPSEPAPVGESIDDARLLERVGHQVETLSPTERALIVQRYGLGQTFEAIGARLGMSRESARILHARTIARLRSPAPRSISRETLAETPAQPDYRVWLRRRFVG